MNIGLSGCIKGVKSLPGWRTQASLWFIRSTKWQRQATQTGLAALAAETAVVVGVVVVVVGPEPEPDAAPPAKAERVGLVPPEVGPKRTTSGNEPEVVAAEVGADTEISGREGGAESGAVAVIVAVAGAGTGAGAGAGAGAGIVVAAAVVEEGESGSRASTLPGEEARLNRFLKKRRIPMMAVL